MNALAFKRPMGRLEQQCPEYREAVDEFDRLTRAGKTAEAERVWEWAARIARAFNRGAEFAAGAKG